MPCTRGPSPRPSHVRSQSFASVLPQIWSRTRHHVGGRHSSPMGSNRQKKHFLSTAEGEDEKPSKATKVPPMKPVVNGSPGRHKTVDGKVLRKKTRTLNVGVETIQRYPLIAKLRRSSCLCMALLYLSMSTLSKMPAKTMRATIRTSASTSRPLINLLERKMRLYAHVPFLHMS